MPYFLVFLLLLFQSLVHYYYLNHVLFIIKKLIIFFTFFCSFTLNNSIKDSDLFESKSKPLKKNSKWENQSNELRAIIQSKRAEKGKKNYLIFNI